MNLWNDDSFSAFMNSSDLDSFWPSPPPPQSATTALFNEKILQQRLQALVEGARESWTFVIFWQSTSDDSGATLLRWGDGYYKGHHQERKPKATSYAEQEHRKKFLRELNSLISGSSDGAVDYEDVTDTEWFFLISMTQSFVNGGGLPGQAFFYSSPVWVTGPDRLSGSKCARARQGQVYGLQTLVYIPVANGVVELGSTELIFQNCDIMNKARYLLQPIRSSWFPNMGYTVQLQEPIRWYLNAERLPEDNESENRGRKRNRLETQLAGKEKISEVNVNPDKNLECPWPLFTESSDNDSDGSSSSNSNEFSGPS